MDILPKNLGLRPRLAVEIRPEGVVAARAEDAQAVLSAVSQGRVPPGSVAPGLRAGNIGDRPAVVAAVKKALEAVALRERQATVIVPDTAVRVLLLDFDALPAKTAEALPVVRFRLKKLLPFEVEDAVVSYQVMSSERGLIRVLAVAIPKEVLFEYEGVVRSAGFEPGAVLPSTLAACAGLPEANAAASLLVNAGEAAITTAIVEGGLLLLHRTVDLAATTDEQLLPLVDRQATEAEWAGQEPVFPYPAERDDQLPREAMLPPVPGPEEQRWAALTREVTQAVSVAGAYFEDTLQRAPTELLTTGDLDAVTLSGLLADPAYGTLPVREMVDAAMLTGGAAGTRVPLHWMAGVRGALRS